MDTCPSCGAERPSWLGGSHIKKDYFSQDSKTVCRILEPEPPLGYLGYIAMPEGYNED